MIKSFEIRNNKYDFACPHRCDVCDLPCASSRGIKIHKSKAHKVQPLQSFEGRLVDKVVKVAKLTKNNKNYGPLSIVNSKQPLDNLYQFKYLGSIFTADGDVIQDVEARIAMALQRWSSLRHLFLSPHLSLNIKVRLYSASVCSLIAFGSESWQFTPKVMRRINGVNSRMLASFTGKTIQQEARPLSTSLDLVLRLRKTRLRWLGNILCEGSEHITYQAVVAQYQRKDEGSLLMDAPPHTNFDDLVSMAGNYFYWNKVVRDLK